ncbi:hypothetical protein P154DRAFT_562980, partial [Amniculicola lignicola CBS 123094]
MLASCYLVLISTFIWLASASPILRLHSMQELLRISPKSSEDRPNFRATTVILSITTAGNKNERYVEIPLRQRIVPGTDLPRQLSSAKIAALMDSQRRAASLEQLNGVICRVAPALSQEEKGVHFNSGKQQVVWPWFALRDGSVEFEKPSSRWFLAGRDIG